MVMMMVEIIHLRAFVHVEDQNRDHSDGDDGDGGIDDNDDGEDYKRSWQVQYNDHLARYDDDQDEGRDCVEPQKPLHPHHDIRRNLAGKCFLMKKMALMRSGTEKGNVKEKENL